MYVVDVTGGAPRKVVDGDAVQPSWSPSGERIVYWSNIGGQRDIYTVAAAGGAPVAATRPRFSKDGSRMAFRSRIASINPVAIPFDPATARAGVPFLLDTRNNIR